MTLKWLLLEMGKYGWQKATSPAILVLRQFVDRLFGVALP